MNCELVLNIVIVVLESRTIVFYIAIFCGNGRALFVEMVAHYLWKWSRNIGGNGLTFTYIVA